MKQPNVLELQNEISREFPGFKLRSKTDSGFMKLIDFLLKVITFGENKEFMTRFTTTIGYTIYTPVAWNDRPPLSQCVTLRHERIHMLQRKKHGSFMFTFLYLFCWLPVWRAHWRKKFEMEAYEETLRARYDYGDSLSNPSARLAMIKHFTSGEYFWMWTKRTDVEEWYDEAVQRIFAENKN